MSKKDGKPIVCATRGGEGSRAVQIAAIEQAKEFNSSLIFLCVTDPNSLGDYDESLIESISRELDWMGETLLRTAQRRADAAGLVSEVRIRRGPVQDEICRFIEETDARLLLLGAPRGTTANVFGDDAVEKFAKQIMNSTHVDVKIIRPESLEV
ncbi:MAG: universal stress protein [Chloroflexi bacterium]|nr:universal stress protein [Chloroflexota bacterium]